MWKKIFSLFIIFFILRIIISCSCKYPNIEFQYSNIEITNLNNSGGKYTKTEDNIMKKGAVAFEVFIYGEYENYTQSNIISQFDFNEAKAFESDCIQNYTPNDYISNIYIKSLYNIKESAIANTIVTDLFRCNIQKDSYGSTTFSYMSIDDLISLYKKKNSIPTNGIKINLFCTEKIDNNITKFEIEVVFNSGLILTSTTNLITLE